MLRTSTLPLRPDAEAGARAPAGLPGWAALLSEGFCVELGPALVAGTPLGERVLARLAHGLRATCAELGAHEVALPASEGEALVNLLVKTGALLRPDASLACAFGTGFRDDVSERQGAFSLALYDRFDLAAVGPSDALPTERLLAPVRARLAGWDLPVELRDPDGDASDARSAGSGAAFVCALPSGGEARLGRLDVRSLGGGSDGRAMSAVLLTLDVFALLGVLAERRLDARGLHWPADLAPADVGVLPPPGVAPPLFDKLLGELAAAGVALLVDDRALDAGTRRTQLERWGLPLRLLAGPAAAEGALVLERRSGGGPERLDAGALVPTVLAALGRGSSGETSSSRARALRRRAVF